MSNPYVSRGPVHDPDMFFGREHVLREIGAFLRGNQSVSIIGPRKIGKTSLLFQLMRETIWQEIGLDDNNLFVYLDCEVLGEGSHEVIFGIFAAEIAAVLSEWGLSSDATLEDAIDNPGRISFEKAIRKLNRSNLRIVLILDEFERLSTNPELNVNFFNALRSAAGRYQVAFLTASAQPLIELTYSGRSQEILSSPFFNIFAPIFMGMLSESDTYRLITEPVDRRYPEATADFIYDLVGGHPLAVQVSCFHAFDDPEDLATIESKTLDELESHFRYYWHNLTDSEQDVLRYVSDAASRSLHDTTLRVILRDLIQKCLLIVENETYRYPSRAWAQFVEAQLPAASPTHLTSLKGKSLGGYEILEPLGQGGMADVYKARHSRLDRYVALKILQPRIAAESDFRQRFEREAQAVASLRHPNIVQVYDFGDEDGNYFMVMEYIAGSDLHQILEEKGVLSIKDTLPLIQGVANALDYAHTQGVIHRDIKPSNVLIQIEREARLPILTDFGIAKLVDNHTHTNQASLVGTLHYISPEQIRQSGQVDARTDIYSLGVMTYQMLTGELPFRGDNTGALITAHLQQQPPDPRSVVHNIPDDAARAILRALHKDRDFRFRTAGDFAAAIAGNDFQTVQLPG
jgi:tRNA A-37 threonylcarbamoyl transferase component Bud32